MQEVFRDVVGFEGLYQIGNNGTCKSMDREYFAKNQYGEYLMKRPGKTLSPRVRSHGYLCYRLYKSKTGKSYSIHRIVAEAFLLNPENKETVNHIDGDKTNNNISNLEWATRSENMKHAFKSGLKKASCPMTGKFGKDNPRSKVIYQIDMDGNIVNTFNGSAEASRKTGINLKCIRRVAQGQRKTTGGYQWRYQHVS